MAEQVMYYALRNLWDTTFPSSRPRSGVLALMFVDMVVELAFFEVWAMQTYLTDVWKLGFTLAAAIINIWEGATKLFPILFIILADAFLGHFLTLALSSVVLCAGLDLLFLSNVLRAKSTSTCKHQDPSSSCVSHTESTLFYTALALIALGISGHRVSLYPFYKEQQRDHADVQLRESEITDNETNLVTIPQMDHADNQLSESKKTDKLSESEKTDKLSESEKTDKLRESEITDNQTHLVTILVRIVVSLTGGIAFPFIKPWHIRFGIPVGVVNVATFVFLIRSSTYYKQRFVEKESPITTFTRVFVASLRKSKSITSPPSSSPIYYSKPYEMDYKEFHSRYLRRPSFCYCVDRFLIKAAVITLDESLEEPEKHRWKLCTVVDVEETKIAVSLIPMWMMLIVPGIVISFANTYFQEQANHMNSKLGNWNVPPPMLLFVFKLAQELLTLLNNFNKTWATWNSGTKGIAWGIVLPLGSCLPAALVEKYRLRAVRKQGGQEIPMRVYWLLFQFCWLGGTISFLNRGIIYFCEYHAPSSISDYLRYFGQGFIGLGYIFAPLLVLIVGKISERVGRKTNWFQHALNNSHLDRYYWVMTTLCAVNLIVFSFLVQSYITRHAEREHELVNAHEEDDL